MLTYIIYNNRQFSVKQGYVERIYLHDRHAIVFFIDINNKQFLFYLYTVILITK